MTLSLFDTSTTPGKARVDVCPGACLLREFARATEGAILDDLRDIERRAPFRHMTTPGGFRMSVAMTNCGSLGWTSTPAGYRYAALDPETGTPWPPMPRSFLTLASTAAAAAGFDRFVPDACLVNRYQPGARLTLHQDKDERDFTAPIVSVSLGLPAVFLFGGLDRKERPARIDVAHGDVAVWGGPARLRYHGVAALADGEHPRTGAFRFNLTFRKAG